MKSVMLTRVTVAAIVAALVIPVQPVAQEQQEAKKHHRYKLVDIGTFGGPNSFLPEPTQAIQALNNRGMLTSGADTAIPDPNAQNNNGFFPSDGFIAHAFQWRNGVLTDLGALPGGNNSFASWISANGLIVGASENGLIDPMFGVPEADAVLWKDGEIINLGTLGGDFSSASAVNDRGQVVGTTVNTVTDQCESFSQPFCRHAFLWQDGAMQDLGTLGGPEATALFVNERGQVAGWSLTNSTPNPITMSPTTHPFLWEDGTMRDLGTLGGTLGFSKDLNNRGQVVGDSSLAGDLASHPFLWDRGALTDLGTFGGSSGFPESINEAGHVVGQATFPGDQIYHAALWRDGVMTDLGTVDGDPVSGAFHINSRDQVVGTSGPLSGEWVHAFLWENGGPMIDLNTLVRSNSGLQLVSAPDINDRGEVTALGKLPNGDVHVFLLIPCDEDHSDEEGCEDAAGSAIAAMENSPAPVSQGPADVMEVGLTPREIAARMRGRFGRDRGFGVWPRK
jgi:probable HAF family extracellular repeat protein